MTNTTGKVDRLRIVDHELAMTGLTAARRKQLAMEKASLLADPEVHIAYQADGARPEANGGAGHAANGKTDADAEIDFSVIPPAAGYDKLATFQAEVARLAALPEFEYQQVRREVAKRWNNMQVGFLDKQVAALRPKDEDKRAGRPVSLPKAEPWADSVNGAELLNALVAQFKRFVVASDAAIDAIALWVLHTWAFKAWWVSPKLLFRSPTKRCGKTRFFEILVRVVARGKLVSAATCSAVFRLIEANADEPPTLLLDEADKLTQHDDAMRKLIDAGQTKASAQVAISVPCGDGWESREFSTWAPIALAGIGGQADTVSDRSVTIMMKRKMVRQVTERLRGDRDLGFRELASKCARWAQDHIEALADADPEVVSGLHDRAQDNWSPLLAIADRAGNGWPERARKAALVLLQAADEMDSVEVGVQLVHDIVDVMDAEKVDRITTACLLIRLHEMPERLWSTYGKAEKPLSDFQLSGLLKQFEVKSQQMKIEVPDPEHPGRMVIKNRNGYDRAKLIPLLAQYPKMVSTSLPSAETLATNPDKGVSKTASIFQASTAETLKGREVDSILGGVAKSDTESGAERACLGCGQPLPRFSPASRVWCSDVCRKAHARPSGDQKPASAHGSERANGRGDPGGFVPTAEWQDLPAGVELPDDGSIMTKRARGGRLRARLKPGAEPWRDDPAEQYNWSKPND